MRRKNITSLIICASLMLGVGIEAQNLSKAPVVAKVKNVRNSKLMVCDYGAFNGKTVTLPLSMFTEELQIVKLDSKDEALVGNGAVTITDNYILISKSNQVPYKLFTKQGKYIGAVGSIGQGPGEYQNVYDAKVDEKNGFIYLLPWISDKLLKYDIKTNYKESVPIAQRVMKGRFWVDPANGDISVFQLATPNIPYIAYTVSKGKIIHSIKPGTLTIPAENPFNNEVGSSNNSSAKDVMISRFFNRVQDTMYHYDVTANKLNPVFTTVFPSEVPIHDFTEIPLYFMGNVSIEKKLTENQSVTQDNRFFVIDKKTGKGSFFELTNDYLGNAPIGWPIWRFQNGYYCQSIDPTALKEMIEKALKSDKLSPAMRTKLSKLNNSISDNDNNYILYAKLKK